ITENLSWHWLFLINAAPGIVALVTGFLCLPREGPQFGLLRLLDWLSLVLIAVALASLEIGLKEAPDRGWSSPFVLGLVLFTVICMWSATRREKPVVKFSLLHDRNLAF